MFPIPVYGAESGAATALAVAFGAIATITDLRERRVPNAVTAVFACAAVALAYLTGNLSMGFAASVAIAFAFAYAAYRIGAWAGGDAKFFTVMAAFYAIASGGPSPFAFATLFLNSVIAMLPIAAIAFGGRALGAKFDWGAVSIKACKAGAAGAVVAGGISFLVKSSALNSVAVGFAAAFAISFLSLAFPAVAASALRRTKKVAELREGDIPAVTILSVGGKAVVWKRPTAAAVLSSALGGKISPFTRPGGDVVADSSRAAGLTRTEITKLKGLGVRELEVRESVAFAPAVALGFVISLGLRWV
jgi:Flp pilus assembly protein protease CpaA